MKAIAEYAMRGRYHAATLASFFAVLSFILPPLGSISGALIALVTLRRGNLEGAIIAICAAIVMGLVTQVSAGSMAIGVVFALLFWLPVWLLSVVLRKTVSLMLAIATAALISALFVIAFHLMVNETITWWSTMIDQVIKEAFVQSGADTTQLEMMRESMASFMTGLIASFLFLSMMMSLFLGRWWQAVLFNPGGFRQEFHSFRLDKSAAVICSILLVWATVGSEPGSIAIDLSFVISSFGGIAGLALVHHWVAAKNANVAWLTTLYILMAFIAPQIMVLLAIIGFADAWLDMRRFYQKETV